MGGTDWKNYSKSSHSMPSSFYLSKAGPLNSGTDFAAMVFDNKPHQLRSLKEAETVFRHNNDVSGGLLPWDLVNLNPFPLSTVAFNQWQSQKKSISATLNANPGLFDFLLMTSYEEQQGMLNLAEAAANSGWAVGKKEILDYTGYGVAGVGGYAASGEKSLAAIHGIAKELVNDAVKTHGKDILQKKNLKTLELFLKNSPKYPALQKSIAALPAFLSKNLGHIHPTPGVVNANARFVRSQILLPFINPQRYCTAFDSLLTGKIIRWGRIGTASTWIIPAAIGVYNVYDAPQDQKLKTAASETVGIGAGAFGTVAGIAVGEAIVTGLAITGAIVLTGTGAFIIVGLIAGIGSAVGYAKGKGATEKLFEEMGW